MEIKKSQLRQIVMESINDMVNESNYIDFPELWDIYERVKEISGPDKLCDDLARYLNNDGKLRPFLEQYDRLEPGLKLFQGYDDSMYDPDELSN